MFQVTQFSPHLDDPTFVTRVFPVQDLVTLPLPEERGVLSPALSHLLVVPFGPKMAILTAGTPEALEEVAPRYSLYFRERLGTPLPLAVVPMRVASMWPPLLLDEPLPPEAPPETPRNVLTLELPDYLGALPEGGELVVAQILAPMSNDGMEYIYPRALTTHRGARVAQLMLREADTATRKEIPPLTMLTHPVHRFADFPVIRGITKDELRPPKRTAAERKRFNQLAKEQYEEWDHKHEIIGKAILKQRLMEERARKRGELTPTEEKERRVAELTQLITSDRAMAAPAEWREYAQWELRQLKRALGTLEEDPEDIEPQGTPLQRALYRGEVVTADPLGDIPPPHVDRAMQDEIVEAHLRRVAGGSRTHVARARVGASAASRRRGKKPSKTG